MRDCQPIQVAILFLCSALGLTPCAAEVAGSDTTSGDAAVRQFRSGLTMLSKHDCGKAVLQFQKVLAANPDSPEGNILLGVAYDCSGDRHHVVTVFNVIWDHDLDPQEPTAEIRLIDDALRAGWEPQPRIAEGRYFKALLYFRVGRYDRALAELEKLGAPLAGSWPYYNLLGTVYLRQARFPDARQALEAALARSAIHADIFYKLGTVSLATGGTAEAIARLQQAVKLRPDFPAANAALGIALLQAGQFAAARQALTKGTSVGPEIYVYLGAANEHLGDREGAIRAYKSAIAKQPQLYAAEFSLGGLLLNASQAAEAAVHLRRATEIEPDKAQAHLYLALALVASNQLETAAVAAEHARLTGVSEGAEFHDVLGGVFQDLGRQDEARHCFQQAVTLDQTKEDYFRHLAASQRKTGDTASAINTLQAGVTHLPSSARLHYLLGLTLMNRGTSAEALESLRKASQLEPENADYQQSLGVCLAELEKDDEAMVSFRRVLALDAGHTAAYLQMGMLQLKGGRTDEAEKSFKIALSLDANYAPAYFRLGKIYYDRNDDAHALSLLEKARELDPDWEDSYFLLGMLYKRAGEQQRSEQMFEIFRKKKNDLQNLRRRIYEMAPDAFDDAKPRSASK